MDTLSLVPTQTSTIATREVEHREYVSSGTLSTPTPSTPGRPTKKTSARSSREITLLPPRFVEEQSGIEEATQALAELLDLLRRSESTETTISSNDDEF